MTDVFCENCGNKINKEDLFCPNCGNKIMIKNHSHQVFQELEVKPWFRLIKVFYIFCYFLLFVIVYFVFDDSSSVWNYNSYSGGYYTYDYFEGMWAAFWTYVGGSAFLKFIKLSMFYVSKGIKPQWSTEIKKVLNPFY